MGCLAEDDLLEYLERRLAPEDVAAAEAHLRGCNGCRQALAELAPAAGPEAPAPGEPPGRYEVLEPIGAGGMGVVYAARDHQLSRTVALKMLQPGGGDVGERRMRDRLLREARAMARLSHPNVLPVFDVGELDGQVFLAMELIEGGTLTAWLREAHRGWREVLEVFLAAARGLAAAHAAGLIHRDFKPDNVLVGTDGRARVTDFGLASALAPIPGEEVSGGDSHPAGSLSVTALAGSPAYMAPEQLRGEKVDARADVFSYCVAFHEALYGERPFRGESLAELEGAIRRGEVHHPRRRSGVPAWLRRVLLRGLRHDPADRFQSMGAIIAALESGRRGRRRRVVAAGALLASVALWLALLGPWRDRLTAHAGAKGIRSLAVLPLEDLSGDTSRPSFADAVTEALTTDLGRTHGLRVTSRHSASAFTATHEPVASIGRELKVDALLEGSIRRAGNQVRIDLRMIRTAGGEQAWAGRFEGDVRDGFALEDQAARAVRAALALPQVGDERSRGPPTRSREAFDLYLRGKIRLLRENVDDNAEAIRLLERAVALDPDFAAAQAQLSQAYGLRVSQFAPGDATALERAEVAAKKALELDPDLAEAHYATAFLLWGVAQRFMHERSVKELRRALALNPNLAEAHHFLGQVFLHIGLIDQAMLELQKTLLLDPTDSNALRRVALLHVFRGEYDEGIRALRQVPRQSNPSLWHYDMAWTLQYLGRTQEARALVEEYLRAHPEDRGGVVTSARAILFAKSGDEGRAQADIATALKKGKGFVHFHHTAYNVASAYALLGDRARAVRWLRVAAETGWPCYPLFASDPNLARVRQDPRYVALLDELKAQWERNRATL